MATTAQDRHPIRLDEPCILFAMARESGPFRREFAPHTAFQGGACRARFCGPAWLTVLVVETGIGQRNVAGALDWLLAKPMLENVPYAPTLMIYAGFAGALREDVEVGDVVLADEVVDMQGRRWTPTWPEHLPDGPWKPPLHRGRLLTMDRLVGSSGEKRQLGEQHQAIAVDMESAVFAERCTRAGIPFACVRAISDRVATSLTPALVGLLEGGDVSTWRVLQALARQPRLLPEFLRLARDTNRASEQLGIALGELLTLTLPWEL
jgi:adenosylhomocysteine nucleosidase